LQRAETFFVTLKKKRQQLSSDDFKKSNIPPNPARKPIFLRTARVVL
jgi:hypothetical protein